eukprot:gb/GECG01002412.1/.p1 GENE.gb/GECG01002412.1/~~gb/GECG01002412.1/.p1  ORF type:complete len:227 (+),score=26.45 gb/GECG01002412.1/:1-681(+)
MVFVDNSFFAAYLLHSWEKFSLLEEEYIRYEVLSLELNVMDPAERQKKCNNYFQRMLFGVGAAMVLIFVLALTTGGLEEAQQQTDGTQDSPGHRLQGNLRSKLGENGHGLPPRGPPTPEEVGSSTWTLLHQIAAHADRLPAKETEEKLDQFIDLLGELYPCESCRPKFREALEAEKSNQPKFTTNCKYSLWLCHLHNRMSATLGKPQFVCDIGPLSRRWGELGCTG